MGIDHAVAEASRAVNEAIGASYDRRRFTVSKFDQHPDGYLHARVVVDGRPFYFHRRFGSWLAPGQVGTREVFKEPEALLGSDLGREVKYALSDKSRPFDTARRKEREEREERERRSRQPQDRGRDGAPQPDSGVPGG